MKLKRIMAIVLCFAMVLSSMSFSVFAEEVTTVSDAAGLVAALINDQDSIEITLANDIEVPMSSLGEQTPGSGEYKLGGENTKSIVIDLNNHKMTITTGYMSAIGAKNEDATITIKNGSMNSTGNSHTTWNINDLMFANCNYEFENVIFDKEVALTNTGKNVTMKNVTINGTGDYYALWIQAEGQNVTIDGLTINTPGRGIKIDEQYSNENVAKVTLDVTNATFTTAKKAAIMVKSAEGAEITTTNVDISAVAADSKNIVWVDEDSADYQDKVIVNDNAAFVEGTVATVNGVGYTDVATALAEATDGAEVKIFAAGTYKVPAGKDITITGAVDGVKFDMSNAVGVNASMTFNKVTFEYGNENYKGLQHARDMAYNDCTINGQVFLYGNSETFNNCTFNQTSSDAYNVWTYGAKKVEFNECTFNSAGKSVLIYSEQADLVNDVTVTKTTFNASAAVDGKAAIEMDSSLTAGINLAIDSETTATGFGTGNKSGNSLWNNKNGNDTEANNDIIVTVNDETVLEPVTLPVKVATKDELVAAIANSTDGDRILLTADIDYGTDQLKIEKPITLDLGGMMLTTRNAWGGMSVKNNPTIKNGTIVHASNTAAIKVWNATAFEDLVIDVQGKGDANKTIGGIVLQSGTTTRVDSMKNVTIKGVALTNGIETYNCGDATEDVIGSMENVSIDALGTGMLISAPCGTATNCNIKGSINGIEIWIKGTYSAKLGLVNCDVEGGIYAHDEFNSNPDIQNNGTLSLTADANTTGAKESDVTLNIARAEKVEGVLEDVMNNSKAKLGDTYYPTFGAAIEAAQNGDTVTLLADVKLTGKFTITKEITIDGNGYSISADETAVWHTTSGKLNIKKYNKHLIGINADNVTLKNIVLDNNNNAAGINLYCAQNVLFDNVSIINATKGMAALTVNGSTLTIKTNFDALGNAIAMDISNGSGVTSNLGVTVEDGTVFDLDNKTVKFGEAAAINMSNAVYADGNPYFAAMDNAYLYTENQINNRTTAFSNGLTLISDVELSKVITVKGTLNINGKTLTIPDNKELDVKYNLEIVKAGGTINGGFNITSADAKITAEKGLDVSTNIANSAVIYVNGVYRVVPAIAKIGEKLYGTLADAFNAANDGDEIEVISDVVINKDTRTHNTGSYYDGVYYIGDKSFTVDLNGFTITHDGSVNDYLLNFKNDTKANAITLKNGTIDAGTNAFCAICTSSTSKQQITINLEDVTLINNVSNGSTAKIRGGAVLNVKKGTVIKGLNSYLGIECVASTVNIYDGAEIYQNGTSSYLGGLVGACGNGVVNVYGGYGKSAKCGFVAMTSGGTINVHGGEWISNTDGSIGDNSNLHVLTSQNNSKESGYTGASVINVTGGTFHGGMDAWILNTGLNEVAELNITGGIFNTNPQTYVEAGYESKKVGSLWKVVKSATSATVKAHSETSTVKAGDKVTVQVIAEGFDFTNGDWELRYDPTMFELDAAATTYYKDTTKGVEAQSVNSADENTLAGKVIAVGGSLKQGNEIPSGTVLATYTFTALPQSKDTVSGKFDIVNAHINTYDYAISQTNVPANCVDFDITITRENRSITGSLELTTVTYNGDIQKGNAFVVAPSVVGRDNAVITYSTEENGVYTTELPTFKKAGSYKIWVKVNVDGYAEYKAELDYMVIGKKDIKLSLEVAAGAAYNKVDVKPVITGVCDTEFNGILTVSGVNGTYTTYTTYTKNDFIYMGNGLAIAKEAKPMDVNAGNNTITITYTADDKDNYAGASETTNIDADKAFATQTIVDDLNKAADAAVTYTYNGTEHTAQDKIIKPDGWDVVVKRISDGEINPSVTNVADKEFVEIRFTHDNYNDVVISRVLQVEPLDLTITVPDFEKGAGEADDFTTKSVTYTSNNFVSSAEFATIDDLVATAGLNASIVRKTLGEDDGIYDLTVTYTPNDNYSIVIVDGDLTIGMPSDTKIEVVNNTLNGNGNSSADYVAGYKLVLVYTNTATARYTYDDKEMFDLSNAGYEYFDNTKSIADQTDDNYKYVYGIIVKAEGTAEDAYYASKVDFIGTNKYKPEKIVYDADINYDDKFSPNDISAANGVLNVEHELDTFFMYYFLKADYDRTENGEYKSDKMVKLFDVQEVQKFINTKTTIQ